METLQNFLDELSSPEAQQFQESVMRGDKSSAVAMMEKVKVPRLVTDSFYNQARTQYLATDVVLEELPLDQANEYMQKAWLEAERQRLSAPYYLVRYGQEIAPVRALRTVYRNQPRIEFYFPGARHLTLADVHQIWSIKPKAPSEPSSIAAE